MSELVAPLSSLSARDLGVAGGKGANLGELRRAGFAVPDGFVLTTAAYALVADPADASDPGRARERLRNVAVPDVVAAALREAYRAMGSPRVAVRSSATAEDLPDASFAGQQDTLLDVEGEGAVLDAVRRCWASLWNERAVSYRATQHIDEGALRLAVVVQRMVDAEFAGVLFTADPITGRRRRAVIDAVRGLGEQLVSGAVNPDHFVVDPRDGTVVERRGELLDDARLRELATMGAGIETHFGRPQDIEWAIDRSGVLHVVQSRDITTLYPLPATAPDPDTDLRVYFSANVAQGVFEPFTPMGLQTFKLIGGVVMTIFGRPPADAVTGSYVTAVAGMRLWLDLTGLLRNPATRELPSRAMSVMEARSASVFTRLLEHPRFAPLAGSPLLARLKLLRIVFGTGAPPIVVRALLRPDATRDRLLRDIDTIVRTDVGPLDTPDQRLDAFQRLFATVLPRLGPRIIAMVGAGFLSYGIAGRLLRRVATDDELRMVLRGLPHNPTTEMDLELWALARRLRYDAGSRVALERLAPAQLGAHFRRRSLPAMLQHDLEKFLERYGHRAIAEIDLGLPRWSEDPTHLLGALANYQRLDPAAVAPDEQFERGAREADATVERLVARVHGPRRLLARALLRRVRALTGVREAPKFNIIRVFARGRAILAPVGEHLAAAGRIAAADDIWFLTLPDARRALVGEDLRSVIAARREEYRRELRRRHIPRVLLSDGTDAEAAFVTVDTDGAMRGSPASPGVAHGAARVLRSPVGARLDPGEVLVAHATDPGWTPLFLTASALVMEMGGMMSHGAVVAREYGIPAVVGVPNATERIATGQRVIVDGSAGTVAMESG